MALNVAVRVSAPGIEERLDRLGDHLERLGNIGEKLMANVSKLTASVEAMAQEINTDLTKIADLLSDTSDQAAVDQAAQQLDDMRTSLHNAFPQVVPAP